MNLKPDEKLLENAPFFADLPNGEYGKGPIFSGNAKYLPLQQFISQRDPTHLRVVVEDSSVIGLVVRVAVPQAPAVEVASDEEPAQTTEVQMRKGPGGRMYPVK